MRVLVAPLPTDHVVADPEAPTTTPARTAVDLAVHAAGDERVDVLAVLDAVLYNGLATKAQLHEIAKLFEGWPGAAKARALVDLADERAESSTARSSARTGFESWDSRWCAGMQRTSPQSDGHRRTNQGGVRPRCPASASLV
jgi:hypothetical protein